MSLVLNVEILGEFRKLTQATTGAQKSLTGLQKGVSSISRSIGGTLAAIGVGFSLNTVVSGIKGAVNASSDLGEAVNAINVAYGKSAKEIVKLGESAATGLGLSKVELFGISTQFSSFAKAIAGDGGNATKVVEQLAKRGADFASVYNLEVSEALEKFQSGLAGQSEPLRAFGIDLSAATVETFAYENGIAKAGEKLTENQKILARYGAIMEQTKMVQGDFTNTSDGLANSQRILNAEWENAQAELGTALVPIFQTFVTLIRDNMPQIKILAAEFVNIVKFLGDMVIGFIKNREQIQPYLIALGAITLAIKGISAAYSAYQVVAGVVTAVNAALTASNAKLAASNTAVATTATAAMTAMRALAALTAVGAVLSLGGSAPQAGTVPSTMPRPADLPNTPVVPPQQGTGIPGFGGTPVIPPSPTTNRPVIPTVKPPTTAPKPTVIVNNNVNVKSTNASANQIVSSLQSLQSSTGVSISRLLK